MLINPFMRPGQKLGHSLGFLGQLLNVLQVFASIRGVEKKDLLLDPSQGVVRVSLERVHSPSHSKSCSVCLFDKNLKEVQNGVSSPT